MPLLTTPTPPCRIRDATPADHATILAINAEAVPAMNEMTPASLASLLEWSAYARVADLGQGCVGFLLALPPGTAYASPNYRWFCDHFPEFLYIDRIAIAASNRGRGIGSAMYGDLAAFGRGRYPCIVAEVNEQPPNPRSLAFHASHGFERVGTLEHSYDGAHASRVVMLRRALNP